MVKQLDLLKDTLAIAPETYKDNVRIITGLDDKAQKMGTIAGVFVGVLLALVKPDQINVLIGLVGTTGVWVFTSVVILLMLCIGLCLWSMWTGKIPPPLSLGHLMYIEQNVYHGQDLDDQKERDYYGERIAIWKKCIDAQGTVSIVKQQRILAAQIVLALAITFVAVMLLYLIHSLHPDVPAAARGC